MVLIENTKKIEKNKYLELILIVLYKTLMNTNTYSCLSDNNTKYIIVQFGLYSLLVLFCVIYVCVGFTSKILTDVKEMITGKFEFNSKIDKIITLLENKSNVNINISNSPSGGIVCDEGFICDDCAREIAEDISITLEEDEEEDEEDAEEDEEEDEEDEEEDEEDEEDAEEDDPNDSDYVPEDEDDPNDSDYVPEDEEDETDDEVTKESIPEIPMKFVDKIDDDYVPVRYSEEKIE